MLVYLIPWLYVDIGDLLALTGIYSLPLIPSYNTDNGLLDPNGFLWLATGVWISLLVSVVGLIGWTYVNRQWRRLRASSSTSKATA
jgi:hypothetical protein